MMMYFELATTVPMDELEEMEKELDNGELHLGTLNVA